MKFTGLARLLTRNSTFRRDRTDCRSIMTSTPKDVGENKSWDKTLTFKNGEFVRKESSFRNWVTADGSSGFPAARDRYHLYVSQACPWAHRTLILRKLKGLEKVISVDMAHHFMGPKGWKFEPETDHLKSSTSDSVRGVKFIRELYLSVDPSFEGRFTVPVLYDKVKQTIVSNESSEIARMLNEAFNAFCETKEQAERDFYPEHLRKDIDEMNEWIYETINNGVYKSGFAQTQEAYEKAVNALFGSLDRVEEILSKKRYMAGATLTEVDIRLFPTLIRFDEVYFGHFKCNIRRIADYPHTYGYLKELYSMPAFCDTTYLDHNKWHYYASHLNINPTGIVPLGPKENRLKLKEPHNRDKF